MNQTKTITFEAIGTAWTIELMLTDNKQDLSGIERKIKQRIDTFDKTYSRFRKDSLISRISHRAGSYKLPEDAKKLFAMYEDLYSATAGKVTPLIGDLLVAAGYDAAYSLIPATKLKPVQKWESIIAYNHPGLTTQAPTMLDFGAAGKGYLIDIVGELLEKNNITTYLIGAGGDMLRKTEDGDDEIRIGLEHPTDATQAIGVANLSSGSICGSAGSRRKWAGLHNIMDPDSLEPINDVLATWVTADTAIIADGLATALFFTKPHKLRNTFDFEYCIVNDDFTYDHSKNFPAQLFTADLA